MDTTTGDAAAAVIRAHRPRALTPLCRCSPTWDSDDRTAVHWSPTHVAEQLEAADLLAAQLPLDLDDTGPLPATPLQAPGRHAGGLSHPEGTLSP